MNTLFLATVVGWYLVVVSLLLLCQYEHVKSVMADIMTNRGLFFIIALFTFVIGLLMVVSHNIWVMAWPVVVTVFSWLVLIGGLFRLFCQDALMKVAQSILNHPIRMRVTAVILLLVGLFLLFHVYYM